MKSSALRTDRQSAYIYSLGRNRVFSAQDVGLKEEQAPGSAAVIEQIFSAGSLVPKVSEWVSE